MESVHLLDFRDLLVTEITKFIDHGYLELYGNLYTMDTFKVPNVPLSHIVNIF